MSCTRKKEDTNTPLVSLPYGTKSFRLYWYDLYYGFGPSVLVPQSFTRGTDPRQRWNKDSGNICSTVDVRGRDLEMNWGNDN